MHHVASFRPLIFQFCAKADDLSVEKLQGAILQAFRQHELTAASHRIAI